MPRAAAVHPGVRPPVLSVAAVRRLMINPVTDGTVAHVTLGAEVPLQGFRQETVGAMT
jgi:hypothetical protein